MADSVCKNLCAILYGKGEFRFETRPIPEPGEDEVVVRTSSVSLCGTDVTFWSKGGFGENVVKEPKILGHEASGTVTKCGSNVTQVKPGDRVAIDPCASCRFCEFCMTGRYNLCPGARVSGIVQKDGSLSRYSKHHVSCCHKIPDNVTLEEGALCQPLAVSIHTCRRAKVSLGHVVLICGAGPIGLVCLLVAKSMGATKVILTDINAQRLETAKKFGANHVHLIERGDTSEDFVREVTEILGCAPDVSIECSGAESSIESAILTTKLGGTVALVGLGQARVKVPVVDAIVREIDICGVWRYANCYGIALQMISLGLVDLKKLVTHRFELEQTVDAFEKAKSGEGLKVIIQC